MIIKREPERPNNTALIKDKVVCFKRENTFSFNSFSSIYFYDSFRILTSFILVGLFNIFFP